jgi:predicted O-methyltransferase YrrM
MRMPATRRLMLVAAAASTAAVISVLVLGILAVLPLADAIQLATTVAALGVLALVFVGQRRVDGKIQRLTRSHRRHAESANDSKADTELVARLDDILASLGEDRVMVLTHNGALFDQLAVVEQRVTSVTSALTHDVSALRTPLDKVSREVSGLAPRLDQLAGAISGLGRTSKANYEQLEAYVDLRGIIPARAPMPKLRGWAASPDVLRLLADDMFRRRPKLIVECGSGASSVWLGYVAERTESARVVALEHDERFAAISRDLIRAHGLEDFVEVRLAPLTPWRTGDRDYLWYDRDALDDLVDIGLLFVDGPPGTTASQARFPAIPLLLPRCAEDALIVLDDAARDDESAISDQWLAEHPELERTVRPFDKGAHVFTRRTT